jgi:hypothetical protein
VRTQVRQGVRIGSVALSTPDALPLSVRATCTGLIANTVYPAAINAVTHAPPVGLDPHRYLARLGVLAELLTDHRVQPGHPRHPLSPSQVLAHRRPVASVNSTSWCISAQSSPTNSNPSALLVADHPVQPAGEPSATS